MKKLHVFSDWLLECRIRAAYRRFAFDYSNPTDRSQAWNEMTRLILQRSPGQISRMERERGLA